MKLVPVVEEEDGADDIQHRMQTPGLHLPDPPLESEDEDEEGAAALSSHSSIPMDPEHKEAGEKDDGWSKSACTRFLPGVGRCSVG
ncbi:rCG45946, partial [Rattus norvegicus]